MFIKKYAQSASSKIHQTHPLIAETSLNFTNFFKYVPGSFMDQTETTTQVKSPDTKVESLTCRGGHDTWQRGIGRAWRRRCRSSGRGRL